MPQHMAFIKGYYYEINYVLLDYCFFFPMQHLKTKKLALDVCYEANKFVTAHFGKWQCHVSMNISLMPP